MSSQYSNLAISENGFLFDTRTGNTYSLSQTAAFVLKALIQGTKRDALLDELVAHYEVEPDTARQDIEQFLHRLEGLQLIESAELRKSPR